MSSPNKAEEYSSVNVPARTGLHQNQNLQEELRMSSQLWGIEVGMTDNSVQTQI